MSEFEIEQWIDAPIDVVFDYFTESERMLEWHGVEARLDPRPGGLFWVRLENGAVLRGAFVEVVRPSRVVFTWGFEARDAAETGSTAAGTSRVDVRLQDRDGRTHIHLRHTGFRATDPVGEGWGHFLGQLAKAVLAGGAGGSGE